eukprot:6463048-Amphidinium_carterae.1
MAKVLTFLTHFFVLLRWRHIVVLWTATPCSAASAFMAFSDFPALDEASAEAATSPATSELHSSTFVAIHLTTFLQACHSLLDGI